MRVEEEIIKQHEKDLEREAIRENNRKFKPVIVRKKTYRILAPRFVKSWVKNLAMKNGDYAQKWYLAVPVDVELVIHRFVSQVEKPPQKVQNFVPSNFNIRHQDTGLLPEEMSSTNLKATNFINIHTDTHLAYVGTDPSSEVNQVPIVSHSDTRILIHNSPHIHKTSHQGMDKSNIPQSILNKDSQINTESLHSSLNERNFNTTLKINQSESSSDSSMNPFEHQEILHSLNNDDEQLIVEAQQEDNLQSTKEIKSWLESQNFTKKSFKAMCKDRQLDHTQFSPLQSPNKNKTIRDYRTERVNDPENRILYGEAWRRAVEELEYLKKNS
eukprot:GHVR01156494.1.p1 GENE.GHVR01156494.1~~GHVR01156494.1.p1  ORF type:complete len:328 (-),score=37.07 GHVR01156494.1:715-1698(-)